MSEYQSNRPRRRPEAPQPPPAAAPCAVNDRADLVDVARRCEALLTRQGWVVPPSIPWSALAPEQQLLADARAVLRRVE
jgi:hypothetical protein